MSFRIDDEMNQVQPQQRMYFSRGQEVRITEPIPIGLRMP